MIILESRHFLVTIAKIHKNRDPDFFDEKYFSWIPLEKHLLIIGRTKLIAMTQLWALWKDMLLHLTIDHIILRQGLDTRKVDGGKWCVHNPHLTLDENFFFRCCHFAALRTSCHSHSVLHFIPVMSVRGIPKSEIHEFKMACLPQSRNQGGDLAGGRKNMFWTPTELLFLQ